LDPLSLRQKIVYVFGGSTGIGLAAARKFAAHGADVMVFARRREPLERAVGEIEHCRESDRQRVACRAVDVAEPDAVAAVIRTAVAEFGVPYVLLNCAGRARPDYFENISHEQWAETMRINLFGCRHTIHALLPHMKQRGGYIVNVASLAGIIGVFGYTDYSASKFALIGFSEALHSELKRFGITVSVLCPPDTDTPGLAEENRNKPPETKAVSRAARVMTPEKVVASLLWGMRRRKFLIVPGFEARFSVWAKRHCPRLVAWVTDRIIARAGA